MAPAREPFHIIERVGGGASGTVYKARDLNDETKIVAVKKISFKVHKINPKKFREPSILAEISDVGHINIVRLLKPIYCDAHSNLSIPMDFFQNDLGCHMAADKNEGTYTDYESRKTILRGILLGLKQMHDRGIMHRDIKPSNIMMDESVTPPIPKIADFGLSRGNFIKGDKLTPQIGTPGYIAPEILLGASYDTKVDIWGVGCVFFEMLTLVGNLVIGRNEAEQLESIFSTLGSPSRLDWPEARELKFAAFVPEPKAPDTPLEEKLPNIKPVEMSLLKKLLRLNPSFRITVDEALADEYFSDQV